MLARGWEWFTERAHTTHAKAWLALLSFTESSIFIVPPDPLLVAMLLVRADRWLWYSLYTTIFSLLGAVFGYVLGAFFFDSVGARIIDFYGLTEQFASLQQTLQGDVFFVTLLAAFTPIPYKVFVLSFGFLHANFFAFLLASIVGRGARYVALGYATHRFGWAALVAVRRHSALATIVAAIILILYFSRHLFT